MGQPLRILAPVAFLLVSACDRGVEERNADNSNAAVDGLEDEAANTDAAKSLDTQSFVDNAAASDMYEIEAGKLASEKASNSELKAYGQMLVTDHTKSSAEMKAAAAETPPGVMPPTSLPTDKQAKIDELKAASGADFDRLFLAQQVEAHTAALKLLEEYGSGGEAPALREFASRTAPVVQGHLARAKSLQK